MSRDEEFERERRYERFEKGIVRATRDAGSIPPPPAASGRTAWGVAGHCPMGCGQTLFLGKGGHVTCSWIECPNPSAASDLLRRKPHRRVACSYCGCASDPCTPECLSHQDLPEPPTPRHAPDKLVPDGAVVRWVERHLPRLARWLFQSESA